MYKEILQGIDNIAVWPVVSFIIFFTFFLCLLWWTFSVDKKFVNTMKHLPLHDGLDAELNQKPESL
jgi:cytochrome c oxidase cbb3-type subunit IV